ncbi:YqiJ family protein [Methylomonas rivi]|uniref:YqiJ family protein n=1 Tax=Methylomonas rivi TaxID=2952226 RepID=A0ABT1U6B1_9GAMM|nr:YqiJ family protein [Methylomonas sp. WSC-6]MCQ8129398.1 YqiJ family protein [Methylomonas sp. WSC-6]
MELLLAPQSLPFTAALVLVLLIGIIESVAVLSGLTLSGWLDTLFIDSLPGATDSWLGWLHVGRVPILVLLVTWLTAFSMIGMSFNALAYGLFELYLHPLLSVPAALVFSLPLVRLAGAGLAKILPKDETSAVLLETLVGRTAVVINGTARANYPAEAKTKNEQGQTFYVRVEPEQDSQTFSAGQSVLLIKQISGTRFLAIANPRPDLL